MREIAGPERQLLAGVNARKVGIRGARVEVVGVHAPTVFQVKVHRTGGVVGPEHNIRVDDVVARIERIERRTGAIRQPIDVGAFQAVDHASAVRVGVGPIGAGEVFHRIGNAVPVEIVGLNVIGWVTFGVGAVEVFRSVIHPTRIGVKCIVSGRPHVRGTVGDANEGQVTAGRVFEVIVETVSVIVEEVAARLVGVGVVKHFVEVVHSVVVRIRQCWVGEPPKGAEQLLPVSKAVTVRVFVVVVAVVAVTPDAAVGHRLRVAERAVAVGHIGCRARGAR